MSSVAWFCGSAVRRARPARAGASAGRSRSRPSGSTPTAQNVSGAWPGAPPGVHHPAAAVRSGAYPELRPSRFPEPSHEAAVLHRQHDALVARSRKAARPHRVAAAAILEDAPRRDEHPAVGRRQLEPRRRRPDQVEIDLHCHRPGDRVEPRRRCGRRSLRLRAQAQQALPPGGFRSENRQDDRPGRDRQRETRPRSRAGTAPPGGKNAANPAAGSSSVVHGRGSYSGPLRRRVGWIDWFAPCLLEHRAPPDPARDLPR